MRLLQVDAHGELSLFERGGNNVPRYAILSHTWGADGEEVTFQDIKDGTGKEKAGYLKIRWCGQQAKKDGLQYFWVDTCCINKESSQELTEAINSMFLWYKNAEKCYAYLADVTNSSPEGDGELARRWKPAFKRSKWFTRGWTLQELIAPASVEFFSSDGMCLGNKQSLEQSVHEITGITIEALRGSPLSQFSTEERFAWAKDRNTTRGEDAAYCLLGIFDIQMPLIYAEGREKALNRLRKEIREHNNNHVLSLTEAQKQLFLDSLRFDQIEARQMTIKNAHAKTCKWLLGKSEYLDWLDAEKLKEHHGFLWIKGKPGAGKSTMMKFALTHARRKMKDKIIISFFFNARGDDLEKSTMGAYRSLLLQLLLQLPALQSVFNSLDGSTTSKLHAGYHWNVEQLKKLLEQAIQSLQGSPVICFIDALDECEEEQVRDMVSFFEHLGELAVFSGISFQICLSSRHYPYITIQRGVDLVLEGQEGHTQDITSYLGAELKIGQSKIAQEIRAELQERASGVFMWVVLVVGILNKEHDRGRIHALRRRLHDIPDGLHELFRDILTRDLQNKDELVLCIQWVLFAEKPLDPEQLYFAILAGVEPQYITGWDRDEITLDVIKRFILDCSKGLAEITTSKSRKVQFIHESIRDFLLKGDGLSSVWPDLPSNFRGQSHERLKQCCLAYMSRNVFVELDIPETLPKASSEKLLSLRRNIADSFPLFTYAVENLLHHADLAEASGVSQADFVHNFDFPHWVRLNNFLEKHDVRRHGEYVSPLYLLAEHNKSHLVGLYTSSGACLELVDGRYGCPLFAALATGSQATVDAFIRALATVAVRSRLKRLGIPYTQGRNLPKQLGRDFNLLKRGGLLRNAVELGDETLMAFLIENEELDPDSKGKYRQTPFMWAVLQRQVAIVKLLLDINNVDVDFKDQDGRTPLSYAADAGFEATVKLLLDTNKVDIDHRDHMGKSPLSYAATNGCEEVVKLLLDTVKVNVDSQDNWGLTPLSKAAMNGFQSIVKLLLDTNKVDTDHRDRTKKTPLSHAARNGHEEIVKLLLDTGIVNPDSQDSMRNTPLSHAAIHGYDEVVKLLLDTKKVNTDHRDKKGRDSLLHAAENGHGRIVKLLLDTRGVDAHSKDDNHWTPIHHAIYGGHTETTEILLKSGKVNVNLRDRDHRTPLSWAAAQGNEALVRLLLETEDVHVNSRDKSGNTPLFYAVKQQHVTIVKLLLETGKVNVDFKNHLGWTPLFCAVDGGYTAIVKLLLETGKVNIGIRTPSGARTLIQYAKQLGDEEIVKLLKTYMALSYFRQHT